MQPRPQTLAEVADRADSLPTFGRELADWLHTLRALGSRPALAQTIAPAPVLLADRLPEGALADATSRRLRRFPRRTHRNRPAVLVL